MRITHYGRPIKEAGKVAESERVDALPNCPEGRELCPNPLQKRFQTRFLNGTATSLCGEVSMAVGHQNNMHAILILYLCWEATAASLVLIISSSWHYCSWNERDFLFRSAHAFHIGRERDNCLRNLQMFEFCIKELLVHLHHRATQEKVPDYF